MNIRYFKIPQYHTRLSTSCLTTHGQLHFLKSRMLIMLTKSYNDPGQANSAYQYPHSPNIQTENTCKCRIHDSTIIRVSMIQYVCGGCQRHSSGRRFDPRFGVKKISLINSTESIWSMPG
jgi:hypothetical protein